MKNLNVIIEQLQEMGKVCVDNIENISELQEQLKEKGYETRFESTDRDYLVLDK